MLTVVPIDVLRYAQLKMEHMVIHYCQFVMWHAVELIMQMIQHECVCLNVHRCHNYTDFCHNKYVYQNVPTIYSQIAYQECVELTAHPAPTLTI